MTTVETPATAPATLPESMPPSVKAIVKSVLDATRCLVPVFSMIDRNTLLAENVSASYTLKHERASLECDVAVTRIMDGYVEIVFQVMSDDFDVAREDRGLILWEMEIQLGGAELDDLSDSTTHDENEPFELRFRIPVANLY